jgi:hypothetical protein
MQHWREASQHNTSTSCLSITGSRHVATRVVGRQLRLPLLTASIANLPAGAAACTASSSNMMTGTQRCKHG